MYVQLSTAFILRLILLPPEYMSPSFNSSLPRCTPLLYIVQIQ
jgi:hypothetical protein